MFTNQYLRGVITIYIQVGQTVVTKGQYRM